MKFNKKIELLLYETFPQISTRQIITNKILVLICFEIWSSGLKILNYYPLNLTIKTGTGSKKAYEVSSLHLRNFLRNKKIKTYCCNIKRFAFISAHHKFLVSKTSCLYWNFVNNTSEYLSIA